MTEVIKFYGFVYFCCIIRFYCKLCKVTPYDSFYDLSEKLYDTAPITINPIYQVNTNYWVHTTKPYKNNPKDK